MRAINSIVFVVLLTLIGCTNKVVMKKSVVKGSETMAKTNVANLIKSDPEGSYFFCTELETNMESNERNQKINDCKITQLPSLFLQKKEGTDKYEIKEDTSFLISLVYKADSLIGTIKAKKTNSNYKVFSWSPLRNEDGSINGYSNKVLIELLTQETKIYIIRFNDERFVFAHGDSNKLSVTNFSYGYIKHYQSVADWVKKTFK